MLELKNIQKTYPAGNGTVAALKGVSMQFRDSEFVSILGPSGCGKTTLLNIIGGLDGFEAGDLVINGRSTKHYRDRDWDSYRNHSVGFVFQSYHLIPHQSVLQNVELALSLSGVKKAERRRRAKQALEEVGLGDQLKKKPAQMSGGQMQRVAIARALVNNPDILLADEPTGALDTETSVQVMDILKEVSKNRLVIMVTHNPELAERYSTRIIRMLDGTITSDSQPLTPEEAAAFAAAEQQAEKTSVKRQKKPSLSFFTSFGLSLKNLISKKGRTMLTSFAGSIGIIGIALIYAVSQGMTAYIDSVQKDTLSSYPLTIEEQHLDMGSLMEAFMGSAASIEEHEKDAVYQKALVYVMINALNTSEVNENDLGAFRVYLEQQLALEDSALQAALSGVQYTYNADLLVYTESVDGTIIRSDTQELLQELLIEYFGLDLSSMLNMSEGYGMSMAGPMMSNGAQLWQEILPAKDGALINELLYEQYELVDGTWPNEYNEIVLVLDKNNEIDDVTLYALGLKSKDEIDALAQAAFNKTTVEFDNKKWSYEEILDMEFRVILASDCYSYDAVTDVYTDLRETSAGLKYLYDNGTVLRVSGIIRPSENALSGMLTGTIGYTAALTEYIIEHAEQSAAVQAQKERPTVDIFTGLPFRDLAVDQSDEQKAQAFHEYIAQLAQKEKAQTYVQIMSIPSDEMVANAVEQALASTDRAGIEEMMLQAISSETGMSVEELTSYIAAMSDEEIEKLFTMAVSEQFRRQYAAGVQQQLAPMSEQQLAMALDMAAPGYTVEQCARYHDEVLSFSDATYESNLIALGCVDMARPATINLYASSFEQKDVIEQAIADYNKDVDELQRLVYTDYVGLMMSSITTIINAITYVLIAFVAVSLVVSSIMIGVITLISVQERTKEIGILRALGASKKNVAGMFNAETVMIGFASGLLGVVVTYLLCIPINAILNYLTGIANLRAYLPLPVAVFLVVLSVLLTLISGIIPSRSAAKKDPVVALRTE